MRRKDIPRREADCIDCGGPVQYHLGKRCQRCWAVFNRGENNSNFKGADATVGAQRARARTAYSLGQCEYEGCDKPAKDRHHISGDTNDNSPENIQRLCRKHHMTVDGRLALAAEASRKPRGSRLTWEDVQAIRASDATGVELAKQYNRSVQSISAIRNFKVWRTPTPFYRY